MRSKQTHVLLITIIHCSKQDHVACLSEWLMYNGMKTALLVPVLRKQFLADMPINVPGGSFWAVDW